MTKTTPTWPIEQIKHDDKHDAGYALYPNVPPTAGSDHERGVREALSAFDQRVKSGQHSEPKRPRWRRRRPRR